MKAFLFAVVALAGVTAFAENLSFDPLSMRWTFGAHEPYTMYRRVGRHCTGGIDGNAKWLKPWLDWWDAEAPTLMEELGFNWLHSRFYKGMGWEEEKKDFPNVQKFVRNCHAHGVHALAYVQFATLYPEPMKKEIPELDSWAQVGLSGEKNTYYASYFRWMPCVTCDAWVDYVKRMCTIALTDGGFDGIMFDNVFAFACYCPRCEKSFNDYLRSLPNPAERFGFDDLSRVAQPRVTAKDGGTAAAEIKDPVVQAWYKWRTERMTYVMKQLHDHIKRVKPDAVVSGNPHPYRYSPASLAQNRSLDMFRMDENFDLIVMQSANFPEVTKDGMIVSRVRELKMGQARGKTLVALCDSDAMVTEMRERHYLLPLMEDAVFGGVPTDRTIVSPRRTPGFVDRGRIGRRKPKLKAFNGLLVDKRAAFVAPSWSPVRLFVPVSSLMFSDGSHKALAAAEEILLRNQVPWNYALSEADRVFQAPADCEVLVVPGITCLSDREIEGLLAYAKKGGRLVVTGEAGVCDEWNAERFTSPLIDVLSSQPADCPHTVLCPTVDHLKVAALGWKASLSAPADGGARLMSLIAKTGWVPPVQVLQAPSRVFVEVKKTATGSAVHFVNYDPDKPVRGVLVRAPKARRITHLTPYDASAEGAFADGTYALPPFTTYALVEIED